MIPISLPIDAHLSSIDRALETHSVVIVEAPPGSGKTTRVAPYLLQQLQRRNERGRIQLLQPRRLAARSVAERIAKETGVGLGGAIGYQVRFDNQVNRSTQLIVSTEGVLLRRLQDDPLIEDTAIVLLDEFHERSLDSDLVLGMLRRIQMTLRDDLKIVIMSATIDSDSIQHVLGNVPIIKVESRMYPVSVKYRPPNSSSVRMVDHMVETLRDVVPNHQGDVLAFLPGAGEIHKVQADLQSTSLSRDCEIVTLFGSMPLEEQARVIETGPRRKIVLSTNIAETSLTIEGVRVVVDSGLARVMRFSSDVGLDRLSLESISQASATQRTGRAGRVAPGVCYRLWSEASERARSSYLEPEIARIDLCSAALQLYAWGEGASEDFPWLEPPRPEAWQAAKTLLEVLGAIHDDRITAIGQRMVKIPVHPRLGRMLIESMQLGCVDQACIMAAMLSERDPFDRRETHGSQRGVPTRQVQSWDSDCIERLECVESYLARRSYPNVFGELNRNAVANLQSIAQQLREALRETSSGGIQSLHNNRSTRERLMQCMLRGYPDRLAKRRSPGRNNGVMVGGKGVILGPQSGVVDPEFFLCIDVESGCGDALVRQASRVDRNWLESGLRERDECFFHPTQKQVVARRQVTWMDLVLQETPTNTADPVQVRATLFQAVRQHWDATFPHDDDQLTNFIERVNCLREWLPELELPQVDRHMLEGVAEQLCENVRSLADVKAGAWLDWLKSRLTFEQLATVDQEAPARMEVPSGSSIKIQYERGKPPILAVKIQEVFSLRQTPRIARGRIPLLFHLLSPAMRPQQVTDDLASFWANGYPEIKKELKRRYPKHSWPDDPTTATPGRK